MHTNHQSLFLSSRCHQRSVGMKEIKRVFEKKISKTKFQAKMTSLTIICYEGKYIDLIHFFYRKFLFVLFLRQYLNILGWHIAEDDLDLLLLLCPPPLCCSFRSVPPCCLRLSSDDSQAMGLKPFGTQQDLPKTIGKH